MKKTISVFVLLAVIINSICFVGYADSDNASKTNDVTIDSAVIELLSDLDIITATDTDLLDGDMTRGEFASIISKVFMPAGSLSDKIYFKDVTESCPYVKSIAELVERGIINGNSDEMFYPYMAITKAECAKIVMAALNRDIYRDDPAAYPYKYLVEANRLGAFDGVKADSDSDCLSLADGYNVIYNLLDISPVVFQGKDLVVSENNVLREYLNIYKYSGIVTDNGKTGLLGESEVNGNEIRVENKSNGYMRFVTEDEGKKKYIGYSVDVYYKYDKKSGKNIAVSIIALSDNQTQVIDAPENLYYDGDYIRWDERVSDDVLNTETTDKKIKVNGNLTIILNGSFTGETSAVLEKINDANAGKYNVEKIVSLSNDGDSVPDILFVDMYFNMVGGIINTSEEFIVDKYNGGLFDLGSNYKDVKINYYDADMNQVNFNAISQNDVLSVKEYKIAGAPCVDVYISSKNVIGTFSSKNSGKNTYVVAGKKFNASNAAKTKMESLELGDDLVVYLDYMGKIAGANRSQSESDLTGFVIDISGNNIPFGTVENNMEIKIYRSDLSLSNWAVEKYTAGALKIDDKKVDSDILNKIKNREILYGKMINFRLDESGRVSHIYTMGSFDDEDAKLRAPLGFDDKPVKMTYKMDGNVFYENGTLNAMSIQSKKAIGVPSDGVTSERERYCSTLNLDNVDILSGLSYEIVGVIYSESGVGTELIVVYQNSGTTMSELKDYGARYQRVAIVKEIVKGIKETGEQCEQLIGMMDEATVTLTSAGRTFTDESDNPIELHTGDMVMVSYNPMKEISAVRRMYDAANDAYGDISKNMAYQAERMLIGNVYMTSPVGNYSGAFLVSEKDQEISLQNCQAFSLQHSMMRKYLLDTTGREPKLRRAYGWDIIPYKNVSESGEGCSKVVIYINNSTPQVLLIIR